MYGRNQNANTSIKALDVITIKLYRKYKCTQAHTHTRTHSRLIIQNQDSVHTHLVYKTQNDEWH